jgi:hypothetical protein
VLREQAVAAALREPAVRPEQAAARREQAMAAVQQGQAMAVRQEQDLPRGDRR